MTLHALGESSSEETLPPDTIVDLEPGRVVRVQLYWQQWKLDSPALAALTEAVVEAARGLGSGLGPEPMRAESTRPRRKVST